MKAQRHEITPTEAERRKKLSIMRAADAAASAKYNLGDVEKTHRQTQARHPAECGDAEANPR